MRGFDAIVVRVEPGQLDAVDQKAFDALMDDCSDGGASVWASPVDGGAADPIIAECRDRFACGCSPIAALQAGVSADKSHLDLTGSKAAEGQRVADVLGRALVDTLRKRR